jgi:hypothetical protein
VLLPLTLPSLFPCPPKPAGALGCPCSFLVCPTLCLLLPCGFCSDSASLFSVLLSLSMGCWVPMLLSEPVTLWPPHPLPLLAYRSCSSLSHPGLLPYMESSQRLHLQSVKSLPMTLASTSPHPQCPASTAPLEPVGLLPSGLKMVKSHSAGTPQSLHLGLTQSPGFTLLCLSPTAVRSSHLDRPCHSLYQRLHSGHRCWRK